MELSSSLTDEELVEKFKDFNTKYSNPLTTMTLESDEQTKLWSLLMERLADSNKNQFHRVLLNTLKILSRNQVLVEKCLKKETLELLLSRAGIDANEHDNSIRNDTKHRNIEVILESLCCLSNIYLHCRTLEVTRSLEEKIISGIIGQSKRYRKVAMPLSVISFDMRLLNIITNPLKCRLYLDHDGIILLTEVLSICVDEARERNLEEKKEAATNLASRSSSERTPGLVSLNEEEVTCMNNLMVAFSYCLHGADFEEKHLDEKSATSLIDVCRLLHLMFSYEKESLDLRMFMNRIAIQLLAVFPQGQLSSALFPATNNEVMVDRKFEQTEHEGVSMNVPHVILEYFVYTFKAFKHGKSSIGSLDENIGPALKVLNYFASGHRHVRKYLRKIILPPLSNLNQRPEMESSVKGYLCSLFTCPEEGVSVMSANFLFILCKENRNRFVKHVGYGNAAGLLARRGLMGGGFSADANQYSDDEDSDTEEYRENVDLVNPISGCVDPIAPSPFVGMSEEQKEYEAMKLVNAIDRLQNLGMIKPAKLGADGKPEPINHVTELVDDKDLKKDNVEPRQNSDSENR